VGGDRLPHSPPRGGRRSIALAFPSPGWEGLGEGEVKYVAETFRACPGLDTGFPSDGGLKPSATSRSTALGRDTLSGGVSSTWRPKIGGRGGANVRG